MKVPLLLAATRVAAVAGVRPSTGCDSTSGGSVSEVRTVFGGESYTHSVWVPEDSRGEPFPLVVYLHGWGGDASEAASFAETAAADREVATVSVQGVGPAGWRSWNGAGTVESPGLVPTATVDFPPRRPEGVEAARAELRPGQPRGRKERQP